MYLFVLPYGHLTALRSLTFLAALCAAAAMWVSSPRRLPLAGMFGIWLAIAGLSLLASRDVAASVEAVERDILRSFLVFFVFYTIAATLPFYRAAVGATAIGMAVLSALAVASFVQHDRWIAHYVPLLGEFTTSATTVLPLLVGHLFVPGADRRVAPLVWIALPLILLAGFFTFSRAFWVVIACGVMIAITIYAAQGRKLRSPWVIAMVSAALFGLALTAVVALHRGRPPTDLSDRLPIYAAAVRKIASNPVTGAGYGHEVDKDWYAAALPDLSIYNAHNIVLGFIDQMGFAGLIALWAAFAIPAIALIRRLRTAHPAAIVPSICALAMLGMVFLRNNVDYFFLKHNLWLYFAHLGIYLGEIDRVMSQGRPGASRSGTSASHPR